MSCGSVTSPRPHGPIEDAGAEVADDRAEAEEARHRHRDHGRAEVDQAAGEPGAVFHQAASLSGVVARADVERDDARRAGLELGDLRPVGVGGEALGVGLGVARDLGVARPVRPVQQERRQEAHAAQRRRLLVRRQEGVEEVAVVAVRPVRVLRPAGARDQPDVLAAQHVAAGAVGPAEGEHVVDPELEQGRHAVPVQRVLPDDQARGGERGLLGGGVDQVVGIERVQVAHRDPTRRARARPSAVGGAHQASVRARELELGVGDDDEDLGAVGRGARGRGGGGLGHGGSLAGWR